MSLSEVRTLCVDSFPSSTTRQQIIEGLEKIIAALKSKNIPGEVWIDGSFVTGKMNPKDVDLVLRCPAEFYENSTQDQRDTVDWLQSNLKEEYLCDSYCFMEWPEGHSNYWLGEYMYSYWMRQFGFSRGSEMKGIAVVPLLGGTS